MSMENDLGRILISQEEIHDAVKKLGAVLTEEYDGKDLIAISVLKGAAIFMADLIREIKSPLAIDFMAVSSYGSGVKTSGVVKIIKDLDRPIEGKDVLIVEDVLDSGMTLSYLVELLKDRNPRSLRIAALLDKPSRRITDIKADYTCFEIPDEFVVGYGLDYDEKYRNLPFIAVLKPEVYSK